ncbi:MAG TPA: hypothetical protein VNX02_11140 [Steroidobacteraceae bacterium]|jgi:hypothetical protein|nr:hypothetical protein [Steroidobacteraceae bacterium]
MIGLSTKFAVTRALCLICVALVLPCGSTLAAARDALIEGWDKLSASEIEGRLPNAHPDNYYAYAGRLWRDGEKDRAVFWLYVGEVRFRFLLLTEPNADPSGDPALFGAMRETIGRPIMTYASSDVEKWSKEIDAALQWDQSNQNGFTSKSRFNKQWEEARSSLVKTRDYIVAHADDIQKKRTQEGIGEVGVENGVYVEQQKRKMPADWPALEVGTRIEGITGVYKASFDFANALFSEDRRRVLRATTFSIAKAGTDTILISAIRGDEELLSRTIQIREEKGAVVFEETSKPDYLSEGTVRVTSYLRLNDKGELVIQRDLFSEGKYRSNSMPFRQQLTFWVRAERALSPH